MKDTTSTGIMGASYPFEQLAEHMSQPLCLFQGSGCLISMNPAFEALVNECSDQPANLFALFDVWTSNFSTLKESESLILYDHNLCLSKKHKRPVDLTIGCVVKDDNEDDSLYYALLADFSLGQDHQLLKKKMNAMARQNYVAAELHDRVAQNLTVLKMRLDSFMNDTQETSRSNINECRVMVETTLEDVRNLIARLRDSKEETVIGIENHRELIRFAKNMFGLNVHFKGTELLPALSLEDYQACCFLLRESLTNVWKHSGVKDVDIALKNAPEGFVFRVRDKGKGCTTTDMNNGGVGIKILMERMHRQGLHLHFDSKEGEGTTLTMVIPQ